MLHGWVHERTVLRNVLLINIIAVYISWNGLTPTNKVMMSLDNIIWWTLHHVCDPLCQKHHMHVDSCYRCTFIHRWMYTHGSTMWSIAEEIKQEENSWNRILAIPMGEQLVKTCKQRIHFLFKYSLLLFLDHI